eukprot:gnl/Trimastix_PCT/3264.p1 GENE.gnl/Trimastix_PCT/3264~~gnl/Trimastix_PCT/3264.p1  ORF type:complete len:332 (-),score=-10.35 gnl/Trimastix_PCT/3264:29-994(-)
MWQAVRAFFLGSGPKEDESHDADIPEELIDPISMTLMTEAVITPCGHSFSSETIRAWIEHGHDSCPTCKASITAAGLQPNYALRTVIERLENGTSPFSSIFPQSRGKPHPFILRVASWPLWLKVTLLIYCFILIMRIPSLIASYLHLMKHLFLDLSSLPILLCGVIALFFRIFFRCVDWLVLGCIWMAHLVWAHRYLMRHALILLCIPFKTALCLLVALAKFSFVPAFLSQSKQDWLAACILGLACLSLLVARPTRKWIIARWDAFLWVLPRIRAWAYRAWAAAGHVMRSFWAGYAKHVGGASAILSVLYLGSQALPRARS